MSVSDGGYSLVTLESVEVTEEVTEAWSVTSAVTVNIFAADLLTLSPPEPLFNWLPMGEPMRYDAEQFWNDVETYGTYDYDADQFADELTREQFFAFNFQYTKTAVEKGFFTLDWLHDTIRTYRDFMT